MKIDKKELKKISYDFRSLGNRIIHANYNEVASIIAMFIAYIERTPLLLDYINSLPKTTSVEQIENDLKSALLQDDRIYNIIVTKIEKIDIDAAHVIFDLYTTEGLITGQETVINVWYYRNSK